MQQGLIQELPFITVHYNNRRYLDDRSAWYFFAGENAPSFIFGVIYIQVFRKHIMQRKGFGIMPQQVMVKAISNFATPK